MMKVLLATDGSDQATTAFRTAARLLRREDSEFNLLCVAPEFYFPKGQAGKTAGETDLKHGLLGSVSTKVTQAALCSTLVVKL
jgi:nucleotide-binding universal stress UspA family protein